jgi:3' exoribonuclease, RNase T-like
MRDIMIDIETLGVERDAVILSIAAVRFNIKSGDVLEQFSTNVNVKSSLDAGMKIEADTVAWWLKQSDAARKSVDFEAETPLGEALRGVGEFIEKSSIDRVWAKSPSFDLAKIRYQMQCLGIWRNQWAYHKERDVRTKCEPLKLCRTEAAMHIALEDCWLQIRNVVKAWKIKDTGIETKRPEGF